MWRAAERLVRKCITACLRHPRRPANRNAIVPLDDDEELDIPAPVGTAELAVAASVQTQLQADLATTQGPSIPAAQVLEDLVDAVVARACGSACAVCWGPMAGTRSICCSQCNTCVHLTCCWRWMEASNAALCCVCRQDLMPKLVRAASRCCGPATAAGLSRTTAAP